MMVVLSEKVREGLLELSDKNYQLRVWARQSLAEMSSFEEAVETLYSDSGYSDAKEKCLCVFSPEIDSQIEKLEILVAKIDEDLTTEMGVNSERMNTIRLLSKVIVSKLAAHSHN